MQIIYAFGSREKENFDLVVEKIEHLIEGAAESQRLEFKGPCDWSVEKFAKDILALSNLRDGGYIIIGINQSEKGFISEGITKAQKETFNFEIMKDQMSEFTDPFVDFQVEFSEDSEGNEYVVIIVKEFRDVPVICKRDSRETKKGVIYYRSTHRRPESAPISNSYDMKQIIELATVKMMRRWRGLELMVQKSDDKKFNEELVEMEQKKIIDKITKRGYWKILFRPLTYRIRFEQLSGCREAVRRNGVDFRGWDYPHFPREEDVVPGSNFYQGTVDWQGDIEVWRMYRSGQFVHYRELHVDWSEADPWISPENKLPPMQLLEVLSTIYLITEVFEFFSRLASEGVYEEGAEILVSLENTQGRKLHFEKRLIRSAPKNYVTIASQITFKKIFSEKDILQNPSGLAQEVIFYVFERFGWYPSGEVIRDHQKKLLERRL